MSCAGPAHDRSMGYQTIQKSQDGASGGSSESSKKIESVAGKNVCICLVSTQDRFAQARRIMPADCGATCVKFPASYQLLSSMNATVH